MRIVKPSLHHLLYLADRAPAEEIEQYEAFSGTEWDAGDVAATYQQQQGVKFAALDAEGLPIAAGGWRPVVGGTWESWMLAPSDSWGKYGISVTKVCLDTMDRLFLGGARRLELLVLKDRAKARAWYERGLKMRDEGTKHAYGAAGQDAVIYARLKGG